MKRIFIDTSDFDETLYPIPPIRIERSAKECIHTPTPPGYAEHHEWMQKASKTHSQIKCLHCGLWAIWLPKKEALAIRRKDAKSEKLKNS